MSKMFNEAIALYQEYVEIQLPKRPSLLATFRSPDAMCEKYEDY